MVELWDRAPLRWVLCVTTALASVAAAAVHFAVSGEHFQEWWAYGVFFIACAWFQVLWAAALLARDRRAVQATGALLNGGVVVLWLVTRTTGLPFGPDAGVPEAVGVSDVVSTVLEGVCLVGGLLLAARPLRRPLGRRLATGLAGATAVAVLAASSTALAASTSEHNHGAAGHAGHDHSAAASPVHIPTTSPAGDIVLTAHNHPDGGGEQLVGGDCTQVPTPGQQAAARTLVDRTVAATARYRSLAAAKAAGYVANTPTGLPVVHYLNIRNYLATLQSGDTLDPEHPAELVYANTPQGAVLVAVMFMGPQGQLDPPSPGGCLTRWHVHTNLCFVGVDVVALTGPDGSCPAGSEHRGTPAMMHVWLVPVPGGPLAPHAPDADAVRGADEMPAENPGQRA